MFKQTRMNRHLLTALLLMAPLLSWAGISVTEQNGTLQGLGHAKSHDFPVIAQQFTIQVSDPDSSGLRAIQVTIPVQEISTENFMRNAHMRMAMFKGDYPEVTYQATATLAELTAGNIPLRGSLTINGIAKPYEFSIRLMPVGTQWRAAGSLQIKPTDFKMGLPGMGPMKVQDQVDLNLDVTF